MDMVQYNSKFLLSAEKLADSKLNLLHRNMNRKHNSSKLESRNRSVQSCSLKIGKVCGEKDLRNR